MRRLLWSAHRALRWGTHTPAQRGCKPAPRKPGQVLANASSHVPVVEALLYSVARFSKKLACSTAFSISSSQGSGLLATW